MADVKKSYEQALKDCYMMAKREIARMRNGRAQHDATGLERWEHVFRFCEEAGLTSSVLREYQPTEITDGSAA